MVDQWISWLGDRLTATTSVPSEVVREELFLLIDVFASMAGPLRRETKAIWLRISEQYGRHAAMRGLAEKLGFTAFAAAGCAVEMRLVL